MKYPEVWKLRIYLTFVLILTPFVEVYSFDTLNSSVKDSLVFKTKTTFNNDTSNEGIILHIANERTSLNKIFFKAYILKDNAINNQVSKDFHLKIINSEGQVITSQLHKIENGTVEGAADIPDETLPGKYTIRVYTTRMLQRPFDNHVERHIYLLNDKTNGIDVANEDVQIKIEGGTLITGKKNRIIVYRSAVTSDDQPLKGVILDDKENMVSEVNMYSEQIGSAMLEAKAGSSYYLQFGDKKRIPLPKPLTEGYLLEANNLDSRVAIARIFRSSNSMKSPIWISGRIGGKEFFRQNLKWIGDMATFNVNKQLLPSGILMLRLEDNENNMFALRPVLVQNQNFNMSYERISKPKNTNSFKIRIIDSVGPVSSEFAVSINKYDALVNPFTGSLPVAVSGTVKQGNSAKPTWNQTRSTNFLEDLYLQIEYGEDITNHSSRNKVASQVTRTTEGIGFCVYVYDFNDNLLKNTDIQIFVKSDSGVSILEAQSDAEGFIQIKNLDFIGTANFTFRTEGSDTKSRLVKAIPGEKETKFIPPPDLKSPKDEKLAGVIPNPVEIPNDTVGLIKLDEATVTGAKRINKIKGVKTLYGIEIPGKRVMYQDHERPKSLAQLLIEIPGVNIINGNGIDQRLDIPRVQAHVTWVIDGYVLPQDSDGKVYGYPFNSLLPVKDFVTAMDIDRIDLLLGPDASIYGSRSSGGVISITTRLGNELAYVDRKDASLSIKGYESKVDFHSYIENLSRREKQEAGLLYWNPSLAMDKNGEQIIETSTTLKNDEKIRVNYSTENSQVIKGRKR